ncbi:MAG: LysR family transcriptional regulator [Lachnospiraceae bacterium]|nr:LysR family transcriptional regulator [Lachnospiraceae bacterium]
MNISMEYYKIFYNVAKQGSVTKAAKELCLSQPAVSQAVKALEDSLGTVLFVRKSKGVELTTEGSMLYEYVKRGYEQIKLGEEKIKQMLNLDVGEIRIGASDMTLQFYLLPYLEKFHSMHPNIKVHVTNAPTPLTIDHLLAGRIDFGVVSTPFELDNRFRVFKGRKIRDIFVAGNRFIDLKDKQLDYSVLREYPLISLEKNTSTRRYVDQFLMKNNVVLNPEFELATSAIVTQFAVRNLGIGCVVEDFAYEEISNGRLFQLQFEKEIPQREICIITDQKVPMSKSAATFLSLIGNLE